MPVCLSVYLPVYYQSIYPSWPIGIYYDSYPSRLRSLAQKDPSTKALSCVSLMRVSNACLMRV